MTLTLTVHRGTRTIGGTCIEVVAPNGERLILDAGRPLDATPGVTSFLPTTLDLRRPATVLFSHSHQDHWGLIDEVPADWTVWAGEKTAALMRLSSSLFGKSITRPVRIWHSRSGPFAIGSFIVTPYLADHSAPDAYMLLIEGAGQRILYSGDFRAHGRKARLFEAMMASPPERVDVLIMEGTNLGTQKPVVTESELENNFVQLAQTTSRHVFVHWSAQNVDRTVTLFRAARRTGRKLVIDLYAADVLRCIAEGTGLPVPGNAFPELQVVITPGLKRLYFRMGRKDYVTEMASSSFATSRKRLVRDRAIIMLRDSMLRDFSSDGLGFTDEDSYAFSNWSGYLDPADEGTAWAQARKGGAWTVLLHTSGHASPADLSRFANTIAPVTLVPVHGVTWDTPAVPLPPIRRLADGESWAIA